MLLKSPLPYDAPHTVIKDLKLDADVILAGHEHVGFGYQNAKGLPASTLVHWAGTG